MIAVGTYLTFPDAQFGTQDWIPEVPSPTARAGVHLDHWSRVTMLPASPLKSISEGLVPVHFPAMNTGKGPPFVEVVAVREGTVAGVVWTERLVSVTVVVRTTVLVAPPQPAAASASAPVSKLVSPARFMLLMTGKPLGLRPGTRPNGGPRPPSRRV
jgi:hypothetical protein